MRNTAAFRLPLACWVLFFISAPLSGADGSLIRDGVELHYRTTGSGAPLLFLSGGPGLEVDYMTALSDFIPGSYERVFLEQRGTGRSQPVQATPENMTLRLVVDDLEALRIHLKQERLFLIGHSWGGMLAMAYAAAYPERIDRIVLVSSGGPTMEFYNWFGDNIEARLRPEDLEARRFWDQSVERGIDPKKASLESLRAIVPGYFFDRRIGLQFAAKLQDGLVHPDVLTYLIADMMKNYDLRAGLQRVNRPVLIIQGHQDPLGDKTAEDIHALIKSSTLKYLQRCGHFPWVEQPDEFRRILSEFFTTK